MMVENPMVDEKKRLSLLMNTEVCCKVLFEGFMLALANFHSIKGTEGFPHCLDLHRQ